jgi:hypothetical protein
LQVPVAAGSDIDLFADHDDDSDVARRHAYNTEPKNSLLPDTKMTAKHS